VTDSKVVKSKSLSQYYASLKNMTPVYLRLLFVKIYLLQQSSEFR